MVATRSTMLPLGTKMPEATLYDGRRRVWSSAATAGKVSVVVFMCNHCPFVSHIRRELVRCAHDLLDAGGVFVAVNSNSVDTHPQDGPEAMAALAEAEGFASPTCLIVIKASRRRSKRAARRISSSSTASNASSIAAASTRAPPETTCPSPVMSSARRSKPRWRGSRRSKSRPPLSAATSSGRPAVSRATSPSALG